jgi:predicted 3-demethylubiquinone-9 3-methyltransferase (glyoxalase superfamily)
MTSSFVLDGQEFVALNGGLQFTFSPSISFVVNCTTQDEVDELWAKLRLVERKYNAAGYKTKRQAYDNE